jgi:hypothetical protein
MNKQQLHGAAAVLLIVAAALFILTDSVAPAVAGLALVVMAGVCLFMARNRG